MSVSPGDGAASDEAVERLVDYWTPLAVRALAAAGVFAALGDEARTPEDIAREAGVDPGALHRFLRTVGAAGVADFVGDGRVRLTPLGLRLVPDRPGNRAGLANLKPWELHAWAEVLYVLRTGQSSFPQQYGMDMFDWLALDPERSAQFDATMRARTTLLLEAALPLIAWPDEGVIVDVGGSTGHFVERVLADRPGLRGVVFDLPHVVENARAPLAAAGLDGRVTLAGGSFFEAVPADGDLYVLSNILHDWNDDDALTILLAVRAAIPAHGRLRIFEAVLRDGARYGLGRQLDLHMLVILGAAERTEDQWRELLARGGFRLAEIVPTPGLAWLDAVPV